MKELEDKIREALPHLKRLSFGCEFKILDEYIPVTELQGRILICTNSPKDGGVSWEDISYIYKDSFLDNRQWFFENKRIHTKNQHIYDLFTEYNYCSFESNEEDFIEIIGHPIMLNDVLFYLSKIMGEKYDEVNLQIPTSYDKGYFYFKNTFENTAMGSPDVNVNTPYLSEQSKELIEFLNGL
jgi:hypothetical protein